jgi:4-oxalocrotonate tautomerase
MPHVIIKLLAGRTEEQKALLADALCKAVMSSLGSAEGDVFVAIEDVEKKAWRETVVGPDIVGKCAQIYKKPGYPI